MTVRRLGISWTQTIWSNPVLPRDSLDLEKMETGLSVTNDGRVNIRNEDDREEQEPAAL